MLTLGIIVGIAGSSSRPHLGSTGRLDILKTWKMEGNPGIALPEATKFGAVRIAQRCPRNAPTCQGSSGRKIDGVLVTRPKFRHDARSPTPCAAGLKVPVLIHASMMRRK